MIFANNTARTTAKGRLLAKAAMAMALAIGGVAGAGLAVSPAAAQDYSDGWRSAAAPISDAVAKTDSDAQIQALVSQVAAADGARKAELKAQLDAALGGVFAKLEALEPLSVNADDKYATGQFNLNFGNKLREPALQYKGLKLMVDSGKSAPDQVPLFNYYVGSLAYDARDYANARTYLKNAIDLGHQADNLERLYAETYFGQDQFVEGLNELDKVIGDRGSAIPEDTYRRALQVAYDEEIKDQIVKRSADLVKAHPGEGTWNTSLRVVLDSFDFTADESLDLFRLMRVTNSMEEARTYVDYIEAADARRMANEVLPVIEEAIALGLLNSEDVFVKEAREVAAARAAEDRNAADEDAANARTAADSLSARATADNFFSLGRYADAEEFYQLALDRGEDANRMTMRLAVAQAMQDKFDEAKANFAKVTGNRAFVASMWLAYIDTMS